MRIVEIINCIRCLEEFHAYVDEQKMLCDSCENEDKVKESNRIINKTKRKHISIRRMIK